jgi:hypothetical protein
MGHNQPIKTKLKRRGHNDRGKKGYGKTNESLVGVFALDVIVVVFHCE